MSILGNIRMTKGLMPGKSLARRENGVSSRILCH